jgi:hypothetical protein
MLICRCAWHRRYHGYPLLSSVVSWRGWNVRFTDGICARCLERFRIEHRRFLTRHAEVQTSPGTAPVGETTTTATQATAAVTAQQG